MKKDDIDLSTVTIGQWADYISLDWDREEDRPLLRHLFPSWIIELIEERDK